jgi:hypothetical protein
MNVAISSGRPQPVLRPRQSSSYSSSSSSSIGFVPALWMTTDRVLETVPSVQLIEGLKTSEDEDDDEYEDEDDCATRKHS